MAATIRLTRMGKKKRPFYRLVVLDSRKRRDGGYLANLGYYNPFTEPHEVTLHHDEILSWLQKGAEMSSTARSLLKREGLLYHFSLIRQGLESAEVEAKMNDWRPGQEARIERETAAVRDRHRQIAEAEQSRRDEVEKVEAEKLAAEKAEADKAAAEKAAAEKAAAEKAEAEKAAADEAAAATAETETAEAEAAEGGEADAPAEGD